MYREAAVYFQKAANIRMQCYSEGYADALESKRRLVISYRKNNVKLVSKLTYPCRHSDNIPAHLGLIHHCLHLPELRLRLTRRGFISESGTFDPPVGPRLLK